MESYRLVIFLYLIDAAPTKNSLKTNRESIELFKASSNKSFNAEKESGKVHTPDLNIKMPFWLTRIKQTS